MDLNKYIDENLDEILNNPEEYIATIEKKVQKSKKKVSWKEEIEDSSNIVDNLNEDETTIEEIENELFEERYNKKMEKEYLKSIGEENSDSEDDKDEEDGKEKQISEHKLNLLNLFLMHYNEKYEKCENYFSNIKNIEKDTSDPMELFFESIIEFKKVKEILKIEEDEECMDYYFEDTDEENIEKMIEKFTEGQMYCLDFYEKRILSPSILICLNYLANNSTNLFGEKKWNIFNLREN
jgi:hypothetical protein